MTANSVLKHALIARFGTLGRVPMPFLLRSDNGLVFTSRNYIALVRGYGLRLEFIALYCLFLFLLLFVYLEDGRVHDRRRSAGAALHQRLMQGQQMGPI